jgi:hypothetical protein
MGSAVTESIAFSDADDGYRYVQPILQKRRRFIAGRCSPLSSHHRTVLGASRSRRVAAQTLTRLRAMRIGFANGAHSGRRAKRRSVMSKPKPQFQPSNVLLVEVPPQFIALCEASGASPQAALRGMAAMVCGLQYDEDNRLVPMDGAAA